jgi:hypothetical protein
MVFMGFPVVEGIGLEKSRDLKTAVPSCGAVTPAGANKIMISHELILLVFNDVGHTSPYRTFVSLQLAG